MSNSQTTVTGEPDVCTSVFKIKGCGKDYMPKVLVVRGSTSQEPMVVFEIHMKAMLKPSRDSFVTETFSHQFLAFPSESLGVFPPHLRSVDIGRTLIIGTAQHADDR